MGVDKMREKSDRQKRQGRKEKEMEKRVEEVLKLAYINFIWPDLLWMGSYPYATPLTECWVLNIVYQSLGDQ